MGSWRSRKTPKPRVLFFNSMKEAKHFQVKCGGSLPTIQGYEIKEEEVYTNYHADLDKGVNFTDDGDDPDDTKVVCAKVFHPSKTGKEYTILTVSDTKPLVNGFRSY